MVSAPSTSIEAGIHAVVVASGLLGFGYLIADFFAARWDIDRVSRWGLALPGIALWITVIMLGHIVTGGEVLSNAWIVRGVTLVAAIFLVVRKLAARSREPRREFWVAVVVVLIAVIAWGSPVARMLPLPTDPDTMLHLGWSTQLANGESTPSATVTGEVPNYYPWLFHCTLALVARFTPGGHAGHALAPLQLLLVAGAALSLFALGTRLGRFGAKGTWRAGAGAVLFGVLASGFGTLASWRSYNFADHNLAPPYPRDLAFELATGFLLLLVLGLESRRADLLICAGVTLGLVGLSGAAFFVAFPVAVLVSLFPIGMSRRVVGAALLLPALAVYGLWVVPIAINYVRLDGFVNITHLGPASLSFWSLVASFGLALPFAAFGMIRVFSRATHGAAERVVLMLLIAGVAVVAGAGLVPKLLGDAFLTVGRQHRYWPLVYLALALCAAVGLADLVERVSARSAVAAVVLLLVTVAVALPPTVSESLLLPDKAPEPPSSVLLSDALEGDDRNILPALARAPGSSCVAAVPADFSREVFAYTGFRLVLWAGGTPPPNRARIRWEDVAARPPTDEQRAIDNRLLTTGGSDPDAWQSAAERYGVDLVAAPSTRAGSPSFANRSLTPVAGGDDADYVIVQLSDCSR